MMECLHHDVPLYEKFCGRLEFHREHEWIERPELEDNEFDHEHWLCLGSTLVGSR